MLKPREYNELTFFEQLIIKGIEHIEKYIYRRQWTYRQQLQYARRIMYEDHHWLINDNVTEVVISRHVALLKSTWFTAEFKDINSFRYDIGLDPNSKGSFGGRNLR